MSSFHGCFWCLSFRGLDHIWNCNQNIQETNVIPANISTLFQRCLLVDMTSRRCVTSNQRWSTLRTSTSEFTMLNNVKSMLSISTLIWTTLDNVETTLSLSTSIFTTLSNVEKKIKPGGKRKIKFLSFKEKLLKLNSMDSKLSSLYSPF